MSDSQPIIIIEPKTNLLNLNLREVWRYRDLVRMLVYRELVTVYKQTILGPIWMIIQPLFSSGMYTLIFGQLARLPTDGIPQVLFYMLGILNWGFFSSCLTATADTFAANASLFGKVYFPRLVMPVTTIFSGFIRFAIQYAVFLVFFFYYLLKGAAVSPNWMIVLTPVILLYNALLSMGYGLWISSITTKYRDLRQTMHFAVQLWMYITPVVYPLSLVPDKYQILMIFNPITPAIELFRAAYFGQGTLNPLHMSLSLFITLGILFTGIIIFNKTEKKFVDTI